MVDSIGAKPSVAGDRSVARPVSRVAAATSATVVQTPARDPAATATADTATGSGETSMPAAIGLAKTMAASPPVNKTRVAEIKAAIANGSFPILPATIADRLMALSLAWNSDEKA